MLAADGVLSNNTAPAHTSPTAVVSPLASKAVSPPTASVT
jgi:hypothetical protein